VWTVAISPDGTIFSGGLDRQILQWNTAEHPRWSSIKVDSGTHLVAFSPDGHWLAIGQKSGWPILIDLTTRERRELQVRGQPISFSADGQILHLAELSPIEGRWRATGRLLDWNLQLTAPPPRGSSIPGALSIAGVKGDVVAFFAVDPPRLVLRNIVSARPVQEIPLSNNWFAVADMTIGASQIVSSTFPHPVSEAIVWSLQPLERKLALQGFNRPITQAAWSPDGEYLAAGSLDSTIRLWRAHASAWEESGLLTGHKRGMSDVTFSADGKTLASCNDDGTVKIWDVETKGVLLSLTVGRFPTSVEFSPDGRSLVVLNGTFFSEVDEILIFAAPTLKEILRQETDRNPQPEFREAN
jgi:WD40 repeat protein